MVGCSISRFSIEWKISECVEPPELKVGAGVSTQEPSVHTESASLSELRKLSEPGWWGGREKDYYSWFYLSGSGTTIPEL